MAWFESVAEAQRRADATLPRVGLQGDPRRGRARADLRDNVDGVRRARLRAARRGRVGGARPGDHGDGRVACLPVLISPAGVQAVHPEGEVAVARAAAARGTAMGLSALARKPIEEVVAAEPEDVRPALLGGLAGGDRGAGRARAGGGRGGADPHARLDVQPRARLGLADDPARSWTSRRWRKLRARGAALRPRWLARWARTGAPPALDGAERRRLARVLRRLRRVDGDAAAVVGGPRVAARRCGTGRSWSRA